MKTLFDLYQQLQEENYFHHLMMNPLAQFGSERQPLLFSTLLPETLRDQNSYEETQVRYVSKPALASTRYSPAQMSDNGYLFGNFKVDMGDSDIAAQLTAADLDGIMKLLNVDATPQAVQAALNWVQSSLVTPHVRLNEQYRAQALLTGQVLRKGSNGYSETVEYYQPTGNRASIPSGTVGTPAGWYATSTYDPMDDIIAGVEWLESKGFRARSIYSDTGITNLLQRNDAMVKRASGIRIDLGSNAVTGQSQSRLSRSSLTQVIRDEFDGENDLMWMNYNAGFTTVDDQGNGRSTRGFKRYMDVSPNSDRDYVLIVGGTERNYDIATDYYLNSGTALGGYDGEAIQLESTLGYFGIGTNAGQGAPGRTIMTEIQERKPVGVYGEAYQTGLPVITEPEAVYVIEVLRPTA